MSWKDDAKVRTSKAHRETKAAAAALKETRRFDIKTAKETTGLKDIEVDVAIQWIENKIDSAGTVAQVKEAVKDILTKMVPYILED